MAQPSKPAKTMSSRLLTMKFMQRGAASPSTPPATPEEPPSKRQRVSGDSYNSTPTSTPRSDVQAIEEAVAAEEQKRVEALEREATGRGDTKWYLNFTEPQATAAPSPLLIVSAGYSTLDAANAGNDPSSEDEAKPKSVPQVNGRRSFGKFNRRIEKTSHSDLSSKDSDSGSESSGTDNEEREDESDDATGAKAMITQARREAGDKARAERKAKKEAEKAKAKAARLSEYRRTKEINLNKLNSISGSGGSPRHPPSDKDIVCFRCQKKGHRSRECPQTVDGAF